MMEFNLWQSFSPAHSVNPLSAGGGLNLLPNIQIFRGGLLGKDGGRGVGDLFVRGM